MSDHGPVSYEAAGVDYEVLDAAKRAALDAAAATSHNAAALGAQLVAASRGEPAVVCSVGGLQIGFVLECLGTKSMLARRYEQETGIDRFDAIGYDTVVAAVNDCCCVGALPFLVNAYFATGSASFYSGTRSASLVEGFRRACDDAGAIWGGGESPTLAGLVSPDGIDLAASAVGLIPPGRSAVLGERLAPDDEIVLVASSGLHANGASLVRALVEELPDGLSTKLDSGRTFGDAVLEPAFSYVGLVAALGSEEIDWHYASHVTGHGWRKLMRAENELRYRITAMPDVPEVLAFMVERLSMSDREAYATFNMGAGFALFVAPGDGAKAVALCRKLGLEALVAGAVEAGARSVEIEPLAIRYGREELDLR